MRGKTRLGLRTRLAFARFNEAPAECGGKPLPATPARHAGHASMRPPQNAGENGAEAPFDFTDEAASMRPPQNAGENSVELDALPHQVVASMRPPQNAGENPLSASQRSSTSVASMRPPQNAGENSASSARTTTRRTLQ